MQLNNMINQDAVNQDAVNQDAVNQDATEKSKMKMQNEHGLNRTELTALKLNLTVNSNHN